VFLPARQGPVRVHGTGMLFRATDGLAAADGLAATDGLAVTDGLAATDGPTSATTVAVPSPAS